MNESIKVVSLEEIHGDVPKHFKVEIFPELPSYLSKFLTL